MDFQLTTFGKSQLCSFQRSILAVGKGSEPAQVFDETRFGASLQKMKHFEYKLLRTIRNDQLVRTKYEIEWQTPEQSLKANKFLYEILANRNTVQNVTSRTEIRPIPAQWKHFMQTLFKKEALHEYIQIAFCKYII